MIPTAVSNKVTSKNAGNFALQVIEMTVVLTESRSERLRQPFAKKIDNSINCLAKLCLWRNLGEVCFVHRHRFCSTLKRKNIQNSKRKILRRICVLFTAVLSRNHCFIGFWLAALGLINLSIKPEGNVFS